MLFDDDEQLEVRHGSCFRVPFSLSKIVSRVPVLPISFQKGLANSELLNSNIFGTSQCQYLLRRRRDTGRRVVHKKKCNMSLEKDGCGGVDTGRQALETLLPILRALFR
jgi:hypothetical protein